MPRGPVSIDLPSYRVVIEPGATSRMDTLVGEVSEAHRIAVITDSNVDHLYARRIAHQLGDRARVFPVPAGEKSKTRASWADITDEMLAEGFGRDSLVIAVGGGVVGDLAGFVAATYMRGIPFVQVPTTLLAMIDASVGGKTGVDTPAGKNLVGAFHQPALVVADPQTLATLPANHFRAGLAEALKHGVIADAAYFEKVAAAREGTARDERALTGLIAESVRIKASVVARDERESGLRKVLNYGHTLGHAIESVSHYGLLHGEAVAIGMALEAAIAENAGIAQPGTSAAVRNALEAIGLPSAFPALDGTAVLEATKSDKKARGGRVEYALPSKIGGMAGEATGWGTPVDDDQVVAVLI
ncbi:MAG TPA: 3-dehydroquinate synthase [Gemmatimonadaceae bacterium]|nr:3-dehydroquinate synthase [Gemmatimonadaceae bacterium]